MELGHVPHGARVDLFVVGVVIGDDGAPVGRVGAVEALWVRVLREW